MAWDSKANLRGPAGFNATGAAEDDQSVASFIKETAGKTQTGEAISALISSGPGVLYVSATGNDSNHGRSWNKAKATIQAAVDALPPGGGTVNVSSGKFAPWATNKAKVQVIGVGVSGQDNTVGSGSTIIDVAAAAIQFGVTAAGQNFSGFTLRDMHIMGGPNSIYGLRIGKESNFLIDRVTVSDLRTGTGIFIDGGVAAQYGQLNGVNAYDCLTGLDIQDHNGLRMFGGNIEALEGSSYLPGSTAIKVGLQAETCRFYGVITQFCETLYDISGGHNVIDSPRCEAFATGIKFKGLNNVLNPGGSFNGHIIGGTGRAIHIEPSAVGTTIFPYAHGAIGPDAVLDEGVRTSRHDGVMVDSKMGSFSANSGRIIYSVPTLGRVTDHKVGYVEFSNSSAAIPASETDYWTFQVQQRGGGAATLLTVDTKAGVAAWGRIEVTPRIFPQTLRTGDSLQVIATKVGNPPTIENLGIHLILVPR